MSCIDKLQYRAVPLLQVPAAAVIPAPIAYIKVVAVKKLVVEVWSRTLGLLHCMYLTVRDFLLGERPPSGGPEPGLLL